MTKRLPVLVVEEDLHERLSRQADAEARTLRTVTDRILREALGMGPGPMRRQGSNRRRDYDAQ